MTREDEDLRLLEKLQPIDWVRQNEDDSSWLITYADMVTLILTLFVLLLTYASFDKRGIAQPGEVVQAEQQPTNRQPKSEFIPIQLFQLTQEQIQKQKQAKIEALQAQVNELLKNQANLNSRIHEEGVYLDLDSEILFPTAEASLNVAGQLLIRQAAQVLNKTDNLVVVEGHTDTIPIATPQFPSNWELSAGRATAVLKQLEIEGVSKHRMRAVAYADNQPLSSNDTPEERAKNRRVSILLISQ